MSDASASTDPVAATAAIGSAVHEVHWRDALPWWILFRAAGMAFSPTVILLAACGGLATWAGWAVIDSVSGETVANLLPPGDVAIAVSPRAVPNAAALLAALTGEGFLDPDVIDTAREEGVPVAFLDPWGRPYCYRYDPGAAGWENFGYILFSHGPDGATALTASLADTGLAGDALMEFPENRDTIYAGP